MEQGHNGVRRRADQAQEGAAARVYLSARGPMFPEENSSSQKSLGNATDSRPALHGGKSGGIGVTSRLELWAQFCLLCSLCSGVSLRKRDFFQRSFSHLPLHFSTFLGMLFGCDVKEQ